TGDSYPHCRLVYYPLDSSFFDKCLAGDCTDYADGRVFAELAQLAAEMSSGHPRNPRNPRLNSLGQPSPIDVEHLAGDIRSCVGSEINCGPCDLFRFAQASEWNLADQSLPEGWVFTQAFCQIRLDVSRCDRIEQNTVRRPLDCEDTRDLIGCALRRAVRNQTGERHLASDRSNIDNATRPLRDHHTPGCLTTQEYPFQVHRNEGVPLRFRHRFGGLVSRRNGGIVDEDVETAESLNRLSNKILHIRSFADIGDHRETHPASGNDGVGYSFCGFGIPSIYRHGRPGAGQTLSYRTADPTAAASHDRNLSGE